MRGRPGLQKGRTGTVRELSKVCSKIVLECLYLTRIGRFDILWSVSKLARAVTKWTRACDKRLERLISHIHHEWIQTILFFGKHITTMQIKECFKILILRDLEDSKSTSVRLLCIFGSHTFVPISWMCKKQTSVSHSWTESFTQDGIPALDLWDLVIEVFDSSPNHLSNTNDQVQGKLSRDTTSNKHAQNKTKVPTRHDNFDLNNVDCGPSDAKFSRLGAMLYIFEDNEAVIKMIIKGRSPKMRDVSRTHRVALDWLFDRINLDTKIQIKYVDTKHQFADILTEGNFTRDEWNNLHHLFIISHFSSLCCAQNFSLTSCTKTMAKRMQQQKEETMIVAKSRTTAMNMTSSVLTSSSSVNSPVASRSLEVLKASSRQVGLSGKQWCKRKSKFQSRRSVEISRMEKGCSTVHNHRETCSNRQGSEISESSGEICHKHRWICSNWIPRIFRKSWNSRRFRTQK